MNGFVPRSRLYGAIRGRRRRPICGIICPPNINDRLKAGYRIWWDGGITPVDLTDHCAETRHTSATPQRARNGVMNFGGLVLCLIEGLSNSHENGLVSACSVEKSFSSIQLLTECA